MKLFLKILTYFFGLRLCRLLPFMLFNEFAGSHLTVSGRTPIQKGGYVKRHTALAVVFYFFHYMELFLASLVVCNVTLKT